MTPRKTKRRKSDRWGVRIATIVPIVVFIATFGWGTYTHLDAKIDKKVGSKELEMVCQNLERIEDRLGKMENKIDSMHDDVLILKKGHEHDHRP